MEEQLRGLVDELNRAEKEHLDEVGPLQTRLHLAIVALCGHVGLDNLWDKESADE